MHVYGKREEQGGTRRANAPETRQLTVHEHGRMWTQTGSRFSPTPVVQKIEDLHLPKKRALRDALRVVAGGSASSTGERKRGTHNEEGMWWSIYRGEDVGEEKARRRTAGQSGEAADRARQAAKWSFLAPKSLGAQNTLAATAKGYAPKPSISWP